MKKTISILAVLIGILAVLVVFVLSGSDGHPGRVALIARLSAATNASAPGGKVLLLLTNASDVSVMYTFRSLEVSASNQWRRVPTSGSLFAGVVEAGHSTTQLVALPPTEGNCRVSMNCIEHARGLGGFLQSVSDKISRHRTFSGPSYVVHSQEFRQ